MNSEQTQNLLGALIKAMAKIATALSDHEARLHLIEEDEDAENLLAHELVPMAEAISAQFDKVATPEMPVPTPVFSPPTT